MKLLRALQESEFERVGGIKTTRVDVRLIAATNRDLNAEIEAGRFRKDLYYRLAVVPISLPPLRERPSDIPTLVRHFVEKYNRRLNKRIEGMTDEALALVQAYAWPGNIRELENLIERVLLFADGPADRRGGSASSTCGPRRRDAAARTRAGAPRRPRPAGETGLKDIVRQQRRRAGEGPHHPGARGDWRQRHPRGEAAADQPQVAADEDEGVLASRRRRRVSVEADGQRCQ